MFFAENIAQKGILFFYDWEYFRETEEADKKPAEHLKWTNNKPMRIFKGKRPMEKLTDYIWVI